MAVLYCTASFKSPGLCDLTPHLHHARSPVAHPLLASTSPANLNLSRITPQVGYDKLAATLAPWELLKMLDPEHHYRAGIKAAHQPLLTLRDHVISLIRTWSHAKERYADLHSRARTPPAHQLIARIRDDLEELERRARKRVRKRRAKSGAKFSEAIERFVGDLLRAKAGTMEPVRIYHAIGKSSFDQDPVRYDVFCRVLEGLKALELIGHYKGQTRFRKTEFDPGEAVSVTMRGHASRFWARGKLLQLAEHYGIDASNVGKHFTPEPPKNPLVLRDHATGRGRNREQGRIIKYKRTPETELLEADIRALNDFLARFSLIGGTHYGYIRVFNNRSWKAGGRLWSAGEHSYQQMPEVERVGMRINGQAVAEIDIKACQLTIYHAMIGQPLEGSSDPYVLAGIDRAIAKRWTVATFGNSKPITQWPPEMAEDYKRETGRELGKQVKAREVARKMLAAFPALKKLEDHFDIWADLQFREAEAVIGTMLILMRRHGTPSLSMHDGIIVPRSKADLAKGVLMREFHRVVGVEPMLTVEPEEEPKISALDL
jgi:hypothetical protein